MKKIIFIFLLLPILSISQVFPGAVGYGAQWTWPNTYEVRKVTNLNNSGPGSFVEEVTRSASGAYVIVVFEVSGVVIIDSRTNMIPNLYIAGQTAFRYSGQGITLTRIGSTQSEDAWDIRADDNTILRYFRDRKGNHPGTTCCGDGIAAFGANNVILDHMSVAWTYDEVLDLGGSTNVTVQNTMISEPLENNVGSLGKGFKGGHQGLTYYRNFISNSYQRNPTISPDENPSGYHPFEIINSIGHNLLSFGMMSYNDDEVPMEVNIIGNYTRRVPGKTSRKLIALERTQSNVSYYLSVDNYDSRYRPIEGGTGQNDVWDVLTTGSRDYSWPGGSFSAPIPKSNGRQSLIQFNTISLSQGALIVNGANVAEAVLPTVGAYLWRDNVDQRQIDGFYSNTSTYYSTQNELNLGPMFSIPRAMSNVESDSDNDGIPDSQEATWGDDTFGYVNSLVINEQDLANTPANCYDNIQNGTETGVDCGGLTCKPCASDTDGNVIDQGVNGKSKNGKRKEVSAIMHSN